MTALDDARRRAVLELGSRNTSLAKDRQDLEIRSHVLSIRESEIASRLQQSESRVTKLEIEIESLLTLLRKEQASRAAAERRLQESAAVRRGRAPQPTARASTATKRTQKRRKPAGKSPRSKSPAGRKVTRNPTRKRTKA